MSTPEYPLFCVDRGLDHYLEEQYLGPFETEDQAKQRADEAWREHCQETDPREEWPCEFTVRRCRRVDGRDLGAVSLLAAIHEQAEELINEDPPSRAWGPWGNEIVEIRDVARARDALEAFLTEHFRCRACVLEPEPKPEEAAS